MSPSASKSLRDRALLMVGCIALVVPALMGARPALAQPPKEELSSADVENAPLPGEEDGRLDSPPGDSLLRDVGQGLLLPPRVAVQVAFAPVRFSVWAVDRYRLQDRFVQLFFDDTETYGLYPTLVLDSSYGLTFGGRFVHRDVLGKREHFALRAATGGEFRARLDGHLRSGERLGERVEAELRGELERRPNDPYYGIGNQTEPIAAYHRQELLRATVATDIRVVSALHVRLAGAATDLAYAPSDGEMPIDAVHDTGLLTGWTGVRNLYSEVELRWDSRRGGTDRDEHGVYEAGWLLAVYSGRVAQLEAGDDYWQYGADVQHFLTLGRGPRTLASRVQLRGVTGEIADVAFTQLPQLGGAMSLRGYPRERFRDRIATLGSLEYQWDIGRLLMASLFVDVGRVVPSLGEIDPANTRLGYGMSVQLHSHNRFRTGITLASSIDGGMFVDLSFTPVFDIEPREEQR